jgi:hypothetical protein
MSGIATITITTTIAMTTTNNNYNYSHNHHQLTEEEGDLLSRVQLAAGEPRHGARAGAGGGSGEGGGDGQKISTVRQATLD